MSRLFLVGLLLLTGCQNLAGPFKRSTASQPDDPSYSIAEQERRGRAAWGYPDETFLGGPRSGSAHSIMGNGVTNGLNTGR
jgi:hypothetical protein